MASENQVKQYLAYWFQLGKKVVVNRSNQALLPYPIFRGNQYSPEFEQCWDKISSSESGDCYLEGTNETIAELLTPQWEMMLCGRCALPIPSRTVGMPPESCPCNDLPTWPNNEVPQPRSPANDRTQLNQIRDRLLNNSGKQSQADNDKPSPDLPSFIKDIPLCQCPRERASDPSSEKPKDYTLPSHR